jgi:hypothetical protein
MAERDLENGVELAPAIREADEGEKLAEPVSGAGTPTRRS